MIVRHVERPSEQDTVHAGMADNRDCTILPFALNLVECREDSIPHISEAVTIWKSYSGGRLHPLPVQIRTARGDIVEREAFEITEVHLTEFVANAN